MGALRFGRDGDEVVLWSDRTGRGARLHRDTWQRVQAHPADASLAPVRRHLEALGLLGEPDLAGWVPCRSRAVLWCPDTSELWVPVPEVHTAGGRGYRALTVSSEAAAVFEALNDARTVADVAERLGRPAAGVLAVLAGWTTAEVQAVQLRPRPPRPDDPGLARVWGVPRAPGHRTADQRDPSGATTLHAYHLDGIVDGSTHFDERETTLAHVLAEPHPILGGVPYGACLRARLAARGWPTDGPVIEVGCGDGELARDWDPTDAYLRVDLSPELLATQARTAPRTHGVLADAVRLPLRAGSVPLLVSNEVLADLRSQPDPDDGWDNVGARALVDEVARVLAPGGCAVLTEFGVLEGPIEEARQLDHPEVAIHFGRLAAHAGEHGLEVRCEPLPELLGFVPGARWLAQPSWMALRALARARGVVLRARAWTPDTLRAALPFTVDNLGWVPWTRPGPGPLPTRLYALLLRRT